MKFTLFNRILTEAVNKVALGEEKKEEPKDTEKAPAKTAEKS